MISFLLSFYLRVFSLQQLIQLWETAFSHMKYLVILYPHVIIRLTSLQQKTQTGCSPFLQCTQRKPILHLLHSGAPQCHPHCTSTCDFTLRWQIALTGEGFGVGAEFKQEIKKRRKGSKWRWESVQRDKWGKISVCWRFSQLKNRKVKWMNEEKMKG